MKVGSLIPSEIFVQIYWLQLALQFVPESVYRNLKKIRASVWFGVHIDM
jgi:hypothetical protein